MPLGPFESTSARSIRDVRSAGSQPATGWGIYRVGHQLDQWRWPVWLVGLRRTGRWDVGRSSRLTRRPPARRYHRSSRESQISIDRDAVKAFCRRHHIRRLALFGSVLRDDFRPDSDVDVLVEFQPGHVPGLDFVSIEREFSELLKGRRVDMVTPKFLNARIRDQVLTSAEPLYVAA